MKWKMLFFMTVLFTGFHAKAQPCLITNVVVGIKEINVGPAPAYAGTVKLDLSFVGNFNSGNKHAVIHLYRNDTYPINTTYPDKQAIATNAAVGTLVVKNAGEADLGTVVYPAQFPSAELGILNSPFISQGAGDFTATGSNASRTFSFRNITLPLSGLNNLVKIVADVYATQNNNNTNGGCLNLGAFSFWANEPGLRASMQCYNPHVLQFSLSTVTSKSVAVRGYRDVAPFGSFDALDEAQPLNLTLGNQSGTTLTVYNSSSAPGQFNSYGPLYYGPQAGSSTYGVWLSAVADNNSNVNRFLVTNLCGALATEPVSLRARRAPGGVVVLEWESSQQDLRGFNVQRNRDGSWETLAFVPGSNNPGMRTYTYSDPGAGYGAVQYRIQHLAIDGTAGFSQLQAVAAEEVRQAKTRYQNPSRNGGIDLYFDAPQAPRVVTLCDLNGRELRRFARVTGDRLRIENCRPGFYIVEVFHTVVCEKLKVVVQ